MTNRAFACVPSAIPAAERQAHFALARELFASRAREYRDLPEGYAIRFTNDDFEAVARFVANERKCCPFMSFELAVAPESGPLWLRMTGPEGTRRVLQAELNLTVEAQCRCVSAESGRPRVVKWTTAGGMLAALGVCAACCLLPFVLVSLGVAGAWVSGLDGLASYKWFFIVATLAFLGHGFYTAGPGRRTAQVGLWIATILAISGIVFEQIEPLLHN